MLEIAARWQLQLTCIFANLGNQEPCLLTATKKPANLIIIFLFHSSLRCNLGFNKGPNSNVHFGLLANGDKKVCLHLGLGKG